MAAKNSKPRESPAPCSFDQDKIVDPASSLPHALPTPEQFARAVGGLGLSETDTIVVYDGPGMFTAPRVWWMLRVFGAGNAYVLDGGFDAWKTRKTCRSTPGGGTRHGQPASHPSSTHGP
jgi:3-mercaptopyruvate sulfurtransferase SseA